MQKYPGLSKRQGSPYWQINKKVRYGRQELVIRETTGTSDRELAERIYINRVQEELDRLVHGLRFPFTVDHAAAKLLQAEGRNTETDTYHLDMLVEYMGNDLLSELHNEHPNLVSFKSDRLKKCKNNTINRTLEILRLMLNLAANNWVDNGKTWITHAPKIKLLPRKPGKHSDQSKGESAGYPLPKDIQMPFFRQLPIHQYLVTWFILMTGCREHEVLPIKKTVLSKKKQKNIKKLIGGLKWSEEVQLPNGLFVFDLPTSKNGQPKRIFLNSVAREIIDSCRGDHPVYVFTYKGKPFQKVNNSAWKRARKAVGLENVRGENLHFRVHDLRHTIGARLREEGVSREDRKDILGHANDDITTHYSTAETTYLIDKLELIVTSKRPSLYVVKNTPATHSDFDESENAVSA